MAEPLIHHPNREKAESKATKAIVVLLLLVSAGMVLLITIGGWSALQGAQPAALVYVFLNLLFAYYVSRWNRGLLTVAAAFAVFYGVLALVAAPSWFARDKEGFADPALDPAMLGLLTFILVPIQLLLVAFCARAFSQRWNVEIEVDPDDPHYEPPPRSGTPAPLGA
ncbi:MAG: hypothetical protein M3N56_12245 [Actinomycetota bacterium]|nr:hypothetical protein [Actinomycetota bacterium]